MFSQLLVYEYDYFSEEQRMCQMSPSTLSGYEPTSLGHREPSTMMWVTILALNGRFATEQYLS